MLLLWFRCFSPLFSTATAAAIFPGPLLGAEAKRTDVTSTSWLKRVSKATPIKLSVTAQLWTAAAKNLLTTVRLKQISSNFHLLRHKYNIKYNKYNNVQKQQKLKRFETTSHLFSIVLSSMAPSYVHQCASEIWSFIREVRKPFVASLLFVHYEFSSFTHE